MIKNGQAVIFKIRWILFKEGQVIESRDML